MSYNVEAVVKFNNGIAFVLDKPVEFKYYKQGNLIIGLDDTCTFVKCYEYDRPTPGFYAFGGREFDIHLENGDVVHCYGQWWDGGYRESSELLGEELIRVTYRAKEDLESCYAFVGSYAVKDKVEKLHGSYNGKVYGYWEYEALINGRESPIR